MAAFAMKAKSGKLFRILYDAACYGHKEQGGL